MSTFALGTILTLKLVTTVSGVPTNATPIPVITYMQKPDGSLVTPIPVMAHDVGQPGTYTAQCFSALDTGTLTGMYEVGVVCTDAALDRGDWTPYWSVGVNVVSEFVDDALDDIDAILIAVATLSTIAVNARPPVQTGGLTEITEGSSYLAANVPANPLVYVISGLPLPTLATAAYWHGTNKTGGVLKVAGTVSAVDAILGTFDLTFDLTSAQSAKLKSGNYSLHLLSSSSNALVVPNDTLIVNEAV